jgi:hypothetical protein
MPDEKKSSLFLEIAKLLTAALVPLSRAACQSE